MVRRALKDMTLEEYWQLFPIELSSHKLEWAEWARKEIAILSEILNDYCPVINHIGSTAIPDIKAKPIVDILVEIAPDCDLTNLVGLMESYGYICMSATASRLSFNKGYTPDGYADKVFHIHIHRTGDNDEIYFRDYLRANPESAYEYEKLKLQLLPAYRHDRDGYTAAKSDFVKRITDLARLSAY
ncbi:MAG: GrpB family protein [Muribaculaceae bacterium]|nr:GrpB family protein [Muribaculaceae bacterium]